MFFLLIATFGAAGAVARYVLGGWVQESIGASFPGGTLVINVTGSLLLGLIIRLLESLAASPEWRAALAIGFCGAYTTFSTFSFETARLLQARQYGYAATNIAASVLLSIAGVFVGFSIAEWILKTRG